MLGLDVLEHDFRLNCPLLPLIDRRPISDCKHSSYCASKLFMRGVYSFNGVPKLRMLPVEAGVAVEKLDKIYFCNECRNVFLFNTDVSDHEKMSGHTEIREMLMKSSFLASS